MSKYKKHEKHLHQHHSACGHVAITPAGRTGHMHDSHLRHPHADHLDGGILVRRHCLSSTLDQIADDDRF